MTTRSPQEPTTQRDTDRLIDLIYDAAVEPERWGAVLTQLSDHLSSDSGVLFGQSILGKKVFWSHLGRADPECCAIYSERHMHNPWSLGMIDKPEGAVVISEELAPREELVRTAFWHDVLRPQGLTHNLMLGLGRRADFIASFNFCRGPGAGPFTERERERLTTLMPHLKRALQLQSRVEGYRAARMAEFSILEQLAIGIVVLDREASVIFANRAACAMHEAGGPILLRDKTVKAAVGEHARALAELVRSCVHGGAGGAIPIGDARQPPAIAVVAPLRRSELNVIDTRDADDMRAVLFITQKPEHALAQEILTQLHRLTPAEARVAASLAHGSSAVDAAEALGVSVNTVKTHLRRVFEKTGVSRQAELASLLAPLHILDFAELAAKTAA